MKTTREEAKVESFKRTPDKNNDYTSGWHEGWMAMFDWLSQDDGWIPVDEWLPDESIGRVWCYIEEQTDLGLSHYQWNCSYNPNDGGFDRLGVTHWMPLPAPPKQKGK